MEKFALASMKDNINRYIRNHPWLKLLPVKWANALVPKGKARFTEIIYGEENKEELGYILDIPEFFMYRDNPKDRDPWEIMDDMISVLKSRDIKILVFPYWRYFVSMEEREYLTRNSIYLLDGYSIRLISLLVTVEKLLSITGIGPGKGEIGIWGADNSIGEAWARFMAPRTDFLALGGDNIGALEKLRDVLLYDMGLACQITRTPEKCLEDRDIIIISGPLDEHPIQYQNLVQSPNRMLVNSWDLPSPHIDYESNHLRGAISVDSGRPILPIAMRITHSLETWEEIGIVETLLFMEDTEFQNILLKGTLKFKEIEILRKIIVKRGIVFDGMVSGNVLISYNYFRRLYFAQKP